MPATRTGRQSSPAKGSFPSQGRDASPHRTRVQPMRSARLRSPSPFAEMLTIDLSSPGPSNFSPSKGTQATPSKRSPAPNTARTKTRYRSRSVLSDGLSVIDETEHATSNPSPSPGLESDAERTSGKAAPTLTSPSSNPRLEAGENKSYLVPEEDTSPSEVGSSSDSTSESDSSSDSDSDPDIGDVDNDEDEEVPEDLDALLRASEQAYKDRAVSSSHTDGEATFADNQDVLLFDTPKSEKIEFSQAVQKVHNGSKRPTHRSESLNKVNEQIFTFGSGSVASQQPKRSKHARSTETSAGSNWFNMPEFGASSSKLKALKSHSAADAGHAKATGGDARLKTAEQLRQEVQAIRLRNALDPKRFYRASAKNQAMPKFAQLGKIIASPLEPNAVMSRKERGRTVVEELIRDAEAASYAKRKFSESQIKHRPSHSQHKSSKPRRGRR